MLNHRCKLGLNQAKPDHVVPLALAFTLDHLISTGSLYFVAFGPQSSAGRGGEGLGENKTKSAENEGK